jgi:HK97 family phage portal protein
VSVRSLLGGIVNDTPIPLVSRFQSGRPLGEGLFGQRSKVSDLSAMQATATLYGVITKLARMTSLVEWDLCEKARVAGEDPVPLEGSRAEAAAPLKVWRRPNPFMERPLLVQGSQQHKDLCGEFWWVVVRFGGVPVELWPVRPDRMFPVPSTTSFIAGYVYRSPDGEEIPLKADDVITSFLPSPLDPYRGEGPIGALAKDLAQNDAQAAWNASLYRNSANPGGIIKIGRRLGDTEFDELVERWKAQHQGVTNAGRVAVLEEGDFTPLSYTQKDMQFVESRGLTRQAIFDAYGFPKFGIGDVDDVNRASAEASMALMAQSLTIPRLEDIRSVLNHRFLPMFGKTWAGYEFHYRSPVPVDAEGERSDLTARTSAFKTLIDAGVSAEQASEVCGLPVMSLAAIATPASAVTP